MRARKKVSFKLIKTTGGAFETFKNLKSKRNLKIKMKL